MLEGLEEHIELLNEQQEDPVGRRDRKDGG